MPAKGTSNPIANPVVSLREDFDEWAVLFNPDTADVVGINPVGVAVWNLLDGEHSLEDILLEVKDRFVNVSDSAVEEIAGFVKDLVEQGFAGYEVEDAS